MFVHGFMFLQASKQIGDEPDPHPIEHVLLQASTQCPGGGQRNAKYIIPFPFSKSPELPYEPIPLRGKLEQVGRVKRSLQGP